MKNTLLILVLFLFFNTIRSQDRFFEFIPGWRNIKVVEDGTNYISIGRTSDGIGLNHYQFSSISAVGMLLNEWEFDLDTVLSMESKYTNDVSYNEQNYITGSYRGNSNRIFGVLIKFNENFTDTLSFISYNILPGNGTQIRTHLALNTNKFILGGFLLNTDNQTFPSLMESDSLGNIIWSKSYSCGSNCDLIPLQILQASDGGYFYTCAELHNQGGSGSDFVEYTAIIKTDSLGNEQYRLHPGNPDNYNVAGWVLPTDDGNYITAYSDPFSINDGNPQDNPDGAIWINKFDLQGNNILDISLIEFLPETDFGNTFDYTIRQIISTNDTNLIIVGIAGARKSFILKVTQEGEGIWFRLITPPQSEGNDAGGEYTRVYGVTQSTDGGYIMAGEYFSSPGNIYPEGIQTAIAVKVDEFGCLEPGCQLADAVPELVKANLDLQVYPNPAREVVNISVAEHIKVERIKVYEITGRVVLDQSPQPPSPRGSAISFDISDLSPGIYLVEVKTKTGQREVKRVVIK